ncbi:hypothetical protein [Pantanalinema sp. GBBB05]|uniref:hypothetical protein n=1 Tax=Pantanalinema sp. GBBB05 TaxID=2604139 RepID=UPI001E04EB1A|nr:hypothetical protein [Pantanalinema sp. GBBB05]
MKLFTTSFDHLPFAVLLSYDWSTQTHPQSLMLNRMLQTCCLAIAVVSLALSMTWSHPLPTGLLIADQSLPQKVVPSTPHPSSTSSPQPPTASETPTDTEAPQQMSRDRKATPPGTQVTPMIPYDPYDYEAIRQMDREIYQEVDGHKQG